MANTLVWNYSERLFKRSQISEEQADSNGLWIMKLHVSQDRGTLQATLAVCLGILLSGMALAYWATPYLYIAGIVGTVAIVAALLAVQPYVKAVFVNAAVVALALGGAELYFYEVHFAEEPPRELIYRMTSDSVERGAIIDQFTYHEILGYAPIKKQRFTEATHFKGSLLYDIAYTIDEHGLRISSPAGSQSNLQTPCILFFGDSFTFGEGVRDEDTLPYRVSIKSDQEYRAYNFGFLGYGPHQMLAQLQHNLVRDAIDCKPRYAIYQALPSHVSRAAGLEAWDQAGPKYVLAEDRTIISKGHFNDEVQPGVLAALRRWHPRLPYPLRHGLEKSALYRALLYMRRDTTDADVDLFRGIVELSRQRLEATYPGIEFHVLLWDFSHQTDPMEIKIIEALKAAGIPLHLVSTIIPDYSHHRERYILHPADGHPNQLTHDLLAEYILTTIAGFDGSNPPR